MDSRSNLGGIARTGARLPILRICAHDYLALFVRTTGLGVDGQLRYDRRMHYRGLRESGAPSNEEDVEPYFPEPLVELDLDE